MHRHSKYYWLIFAGLFGGLAEVIWVGLYTGFSHLTLSAVGYTVAATVFPNGGALLLSPLSGLIIHLLLSVLLALGFGYIIWPLIEKFFQQRQVTMIASLVTLALVWKINFFLLLPLWNAHFVNLLPLAVSLISKLLFGLTMGTVLSWYKKQNS